MTTKTRTAIATALPFSALALASFASCKMGNAGYTMRVNLIPVATTDSAEKLDAICREWQMVTGATCGSIELVEPDGRVYAD